MKKGIALVAIVAFFVAVLSSCKTSQHCPAYGQVEKPAQDKNV